MEERHCGRLVSLFMPLDECNLGGSFSGDEQVELAFLGTYLGDVGVEVANPVNLHFTVSLDGMPQSCGCLENLALIASRQM